MSTPSTSVTDPLARVHAQLPSWDPLFKRDTADVPLTIRKETQERSNVLTRSWVEDFGNSVTVAMELARNATAPDALASQRTTRLSTLGGRDSNAYLYIVIVVSFYGVFLIGIMLGYLRTKRREKRRSNAFTRLLHEEEQREWGASQKKHSFSLPSFPGLRSAPVPFMLGTGRHMGCALESGRVLAPLACALCSVEQSSVSSLSSTADVRFTIEEEPISGEGYEEPAKTNSGPDHNCDGSGKNLETC